MGESLSKIKSMCLLDYANYLEKGNEIEKAIAHYKKAVLLDLSNRYAHGRLSAVLISKRQFEAALDYCNQAIMIKLEKKNKKTLGLGASTADGNQVNANYLQNDYAGGRGICKDQINISVSSLYSTPVIY
ncbi:MAG: hypothetical protein ABSA46_15455 [Thermodesulfovibrionales bacterium]|jgi:tetratricopeptide (TPR) repeat protein